MSHCSTSRHFPLGDLSVVFGNVVDTGQKNVFFDVVFCTSPNLVTSGIDLERQKGDALLHVGQPWFFVLWGPH